MPLSRNDVQAQVQPLSGRIVDERLHGARIFLGCCRHISSRILFSQIVLEALDFDLIGYSKIYGAAFGVCERNGSFNQFGSFLFTHSEPHERLKLEMRSFSLADFCYGVLLRERCLAGYPTSRTAMKGGNLLVPINNSLYRRRNEDTYNFDLFHWHFESQSYFL